MNFAKPLLSWRCSTMPLHDEIVEKLRGMNLRCNSFISKPSLNQQATTS